MTATFGVTDLGLLVPRIQDLLEEFDSELREAFGPTLDLSVESVEGQFTGITAERLAKAWEALENLADLLNDGAARGRLLDALCALTGTYRRSPTFSVVGLVLAGDATTTVNGSSLVSNGQPAYQFQTIGDVDLVASSARVDSTPYEKGDRVTNAGNVYQANNAGTSGSNSGPGDRRPEYTLRPSSLATPLLLSDGSLAVPDGGIAWIWIGPGDASATVNARAVTSGPVFIAAGGLDTIDTPISGLTGVLNPLDVTPGANQQTDEDLILTRNAELAAIGTSPPDALRGRLLRVGFGTTNPVTAVTIFRNVNDVTDGDGIPPHATEAMVRGGEDADIRAELWACVSSGGVTHGNVSGTIVDSEGNDQTVKFSRATEINVYIDISLTKDPLAYPLDGDAQIKAIIVAVGVAQANGIDVNAWAIGVLCAITGVIKVTSVKIGTAPGPTLSDDIVMTKRQRAVFDTSRIAVTAIDGTY